MKRFAVAVVLVCLWASTALAGPCFNTTVNGQLFYICNPPIVDRDEPFIPRYYQPPQTYGPPPQNWNQTPRWQAPNAGMNGFVPPSTNQNMEGDEQ